ncbi:hypothetical protein Nepgr_021954 [Nepenthes gracilis]|uniref:Uncharacterized protein n=1 Tax=Nepenthes gracilis TaxID=150966 RepID=A0AAD3XWI4_NEPGR|nr:hypothetical protein Nepgr_021954 [Nepenthes gracilis]
MRRAAIGPPNRISTVSVVAERERDERDKRRNDQSKLQPIYSHRRKLTPFLFGKLCEFCEFVLRHRVRLGMRFLLVFQSYNKLFYEIDARDDGSNRIAFLVIFMWLIVMERCWVKGEQSCQVTSR